MHDSVERSVFVTLTGMTVVLVLWAGAAVVLAWLLVVGRHWLRRAIGQREELEQVV